MGSLVLCLKEKSYLQWAVLGLIHFPLSKGTGSVYNEGWGSTALAPLTQGCFSRENNPARSIPAAQQAASSCTCPLLYCFRGESSP